MKFFTEVASNLARLKWDLLLGKKSSQYSTRDK